MKKIYLKPEIKVWTIHYESSLLTESSSLSIFDNSDADTVDNPDDLL